MGGLLCKKDSSERNDHISNKNRDRLGPAREDNAIESNNNSVQPT